MGKRYETLPANIALCRFWVQSPVRLSTRYLDPSSRTLVESCTICQAPRSFGVLRSRWRYDWKHSLHDKCRDNSCLRPYLQPFGCSPGAA